jgi:hypothetical protein
MTTRKLDSNIVVRPDRVGTTNGEGDEDVGEEKSNENERSLILRKRH